MDKNKIAPLVPLKKTSDSISGLNKKLERTAPIKALILSILHRVKKAMSSMERRITTHENSKKPGIETGIFDGSNILSFTTKLATSDGSGGVIPVVVAMKDSMGNISNHMIESRTPGFITETFMRHYEQGIRLAIAESDDMEHILKLIKNDFLEKVRQFEWQESLFIWTDKNINLIGTEGIRIIVILDSLYYDYYEGVLSAIEKYAEVQIRQDRLNKLSPNSIGASYSNEHMQIIIEASMGKNIHNPLPEGRPTTYKRVLEESLEHIGRDLLLKTREIGPAITVETLTEQTDNISDIAHGTGLPGPLAYKYYISKRSDIHKISREYHFVIKMPSYKWDAAYQNFKRNETLNNFKNLLDDILKANKGRWGRGQVFVSAPYTFSIFEQGERGISHELRKNLLRYDPNQDLVQIIG